MKKPTRKISQTLLITISALIFWQCTPEKTAAPAPIVVQSYVEIAQKDTSMKVGEMIQLQAKYVNEQDEISTSVAFVWTTSNSSAINLSGTGLVTGLTVGQSYVYVEFAGKRDTILFTILPSVTGSNADTTIASIVIELQEINSVKIGENLQLVAKAYNSEGFELAGKVFIWSSNTTDVGTISGTGLFTAQALGTTNIRVSSQGKESIAFQITVISGEATTRNGNFVGKDGHSCSGSASIYKDSGGNLKIDFASNFSCTSGPDLRVFLSNSASGGAVLSSGLELALLKSSSGTQTYNVPSNVKIADYNYVVVHCKQYNVTFGSALFE